MVKTNLLFRPLLFGGIVFVSLLTIGISNSYGVPVGNTWARADPEPYISGSTSLDCVGLDDIAEVAQIECQLFDDVNCTVGSGIPCATGTDNSPISPPIFSPLPGECDVGCEEYRVNFDPTATGADLTPGNELHFKILFMDENGDLISVQGKHTRIHSFLVIPESPMGIAALVMSSFAALGGYLYIRRQKLSVNLT
jgi:hypothetical protein